LHLKLSLLQSHGPQTEYTELKVTTVLEGGIQTSEDRVAGQRQRIEEMNL